MKFIKSGLLKLFALVLVGLGIFQIFEGNRAVPYPVRAIWVTRFDYSSSEEVQQIIKSVALAGFTDVFFQIRGNGTVFYSSQLEPWAYELSKGGVPMVANS